MKTHTEIKVNCLQDATHYTAWRGGLCDKNERLRQAVVKGLTGKLYKMHTKI